MKRRVILIGSLLALTFLILSTPAIVRWRVRKVLATRYPDVRVEQIDLKWAEVQFRGVTFDRAWAKGQLDLVAIPWDETSITITGGTVSVDLDKRHGQSASAGSKRVVAKHLKGTVARQGAVASFDDLRYRDGATDAPEVIVEHPKLGKIVAKGASYALNVISAEEVSLTLPSFGGYDLGDALLRQVAILPLSQELKIEWADFPKLGVGMALVTVVPGVGSYTAHIGGLRVSDLRLASEPVTFVGLDLEVHPEARVVNLMRKGTKIAGFADLDTRRFFTGDAPCSTWLDLLPAELWIPALQEMTPGFTGKFSFELDLKPKVSLFFQNTCKTTCNVVALQTLRKRFTYAIRKIDGSPGTLTTGPKDHLNWAPLSAVSRHMVTALTTMEDPGFFQHRGFIRQAIENSIRDDLKEGKFLRGGSTLTMQLAKNLWLTPAKTLGRKVQEAFLTMALEGCFSKEEILTLYLNVVEFGRGLYGVVPAAHHYFKVAPSDLTPEEAFYLVSILPRPRTAPPPNEATMTRIKGMMSRFAKEGRIPDLLGEEGPADTAGWEATP